jgi:hypothetical protein
MIGCTFVPQGSFGQDRLEATFGIFTRDYFVVCDESGQLDIPALLKTLSEPNIAAFVAL